MARSWPFSREHERFKAGVATVSAPGADDPGCRVGWISGEQYWEEGNSDEATAAVQDQAVAVEMEINGRLVGVNGFVSKAGKQGQT